MPVTSATADVTATELSVTVTHSWGHTNVIVSGVPNWATDVHKSALTTTTATFTFSNQAPASAKFDWGSEVGALADPLRIVDAKKRQYVVEAERTVNV